MTFKKIREKNYPEMKMNVIVYEHEGTGALHYHTEYNTVQNSFNVTFRTLPENSNGLPHILEHSVLNGSEKFPMHGVFFAMQGRNFETYSNATTGFDTTQYPFSTIDKKGYFNLMSVYLDAVFFPKLEKEVFLQEGWRYAFKDPKDSSTPLEYSGVVYNEMKGAYANPDRVAYVEMLKQAFSNTQYDKFSGGHPLEIPNLSYEEFIAFHKKFYHPSNAIFYTFGSIPVEEIHQKFEDWVLKKFSKIEIDKTIDIKNLNISGQEYYSTHPGEKGYLLFKGYEINQFETVEDMYEIELLLNIIQSGKNDIKDLFLQKNIGVNAQGLGLLPVSKPVIYLACKMDEPNQEQVNTLLSEYFSNLIENGIEQQELDNIFDSVELQVREGEAGSSNIGMATISQYINADRFNLSKPEDIHDLKMFKNLKNKLQNKDYLNKLITAIFIDNKKTFEFTSQADPLFSNKLEEQAQYILKEKEEMLSDEQKQEIIKQSELLEIVRLKEKDLTSLPKLTLKDIEVKYPEEIPYEKIIIEKSELYSFVQDTKGVSYIKFNYDIEKQTEEEIFIKKLALDVMDHLNMKSMTLEETSLWKQSKIGALNIGLALTPQNEGKFTANFIIESKGLNENTSDLINKMFLFSKNVSFEDKTLITGTIANIWRKHLTSYQDNAQSFAITQAQSGLSPYLSFKKVITTNYKTEFLKEVINQIESGNLEILKKLENSYQEMFKVAPTIFFCGDQESEEVVIKELNNNKKLLELKVANQFNYTTQEQEKNIAIDFNIPINHVAYVLPVASGDEEDGGKLQLLAAYLQPYLLTNIREKGGAYGANASYSNNGTFTLYSYRDPNALKTINVFNEIADFIMKEDISEEELNVNKLNIIKNFSKPKEAINKASKQFNKILNEQGLNEKLFINSVLSTKTEDLKELVKKYFLNKEPTIVVATNEKTIEDNFNTWSKKALNIKKEENPKYKI